MNSELYISLISSKLACSYHKLTVCNPLKTWLRVPYNKHLTQKMYLLQSCCRVALCRSCILPANWICITVWFPFFSFPLLSVNQSPICTDQTSKPKESKLLWRTRHRSFCSSREDSVKVSDGLLWHEHSLRRNENHKRLTPCQHQRLCSAMTWHIISACCCEQEEEKSPLKR